MRKSSIERRHAAGVAAAATLIGMVAFVLVCVVANAVLLGRLNGQVNTRLQQELNVVVRVAKQDNQGAQPLSGPSNDDDRDDVPIYVWRVSPRGVAHALSSGSPRLPATTWSTGLSTKSLGTSVFRLSVVRFQNGWVVAGESLANVRRVGSSLLDVEIVAGGFLLILMYFAAFFVGMRALTPVARARRRQAEFASDASHELRTPLTVIEAEVDLALSRPRDAEHYRAALRRVGEEGRRLHRIVEDLLWLARSDESRLAPAAGTTSDLGDVAAAAEIRFESVAARNGVTLELVRPAGATPVRAEAESIDRLVGVLLDNACKFAGIGGRVRVTVQVVAHRLVLTIDDSGPGVPEDQRDKVFRRFHRTVASQGGTGLGLAIADSIITSTHANCVISESPLGGARFEVSWRLGS
jgi:signal transduction histidine kinase